MFGELEFKGTNVLRIDFSLCDSSCDSGGLLKWRLLGFLCERAKEKLSSAGKRVRRVAQRSEQMLAVVALASSIDQRSRRTMRST